MNRVSLVSASPLPDGSDPHTRPRSGEEARVGAHTGPSDGSEGLWLRDRKPTVPFTLAARGTCLLHAPGAPGVPAKARVRWVTCGCGWLPGAL